MGRNKNREFKLRIPQVTLNIDRELIFGVKFDCYFLKVALFLHHVFSRNRSLTNYMCDRTLAQSHDYTILK